MSPETRDFLATVRGAEDPGPADEDRVLGALEASIAGSPPSLAPEAASVSKVAAAGTGTGLKVLAALLGVSVSAVLVASAVSSGPSESRLAAPSQRAPVVNAPARPSALEVPGAAPAVSLPAPSQVLSRPSAAPSWRPSAPSTTASSSASLREEIALLAAVQSALERGDGAEALRRLEQHATSDRQFVAERRAARIAALCLLGRVAEAREHATVFLRENAGSVQRMAVERSCAMTETNPDR